MKIIATTQAKRMMKKTMTGTRRGEAKKTRIGIPKIFLFLFSVSLVLGCGANEKVLRSRNETPAPVITNSEPEKIPFARDLEDMRTVGFAFIYALRRKDGGKIDAGDRGFIKQQTADTNRRELADEGRAVIIGSNFLIPANNLKALYDRFAVENYSPPAAANTNTNMNK